jgi:dolichyl-phosphate-mannose-protein mannosyltransferase
MSPSRRDRAPALAAVACAAAILLALSAGSARAAGELVKNPMLSDGAEGKPVGWTEEAYTLKPEVTRFTWQRNPLGIGTLQIQNLSGNDARWVQKVPVSPGTWYRISGWIRTVGVGAQAKGAYLSVMGSFSDTRDLRGTQPWQPVGLWVRTGSLDTTLTLAARLGGYSSLNTGMAFFTGISVEAAGQPPPQGEFIYGAEAGQSDSGSTLWVQVVAILVVVGGALLLWRYVIPPAGQIPP